MKIGLLVALSLPVLALSLLLAAPEPALADEPLGFEGIPWGAGPDKVWKERPAIKKRYKKGKIMAAYRRSDGGIFLEEDATHMDLDASIRFNIGPKGLFTVELSSETEDPSKIGLGSKLAEKLSKLYGEPASKAPGEWRWKGKTTLVTLTEQMAAAGLRISLTYERAE